MECSICFSDITKATGLTTLSCSHSFHLGCIGRWILKNESCPLCRHELGDNERIAEDDPDATEVDDDVWEEDDEDDDDEDSGIRTLRWRRVGVGRWIVEDSDDDAPDLPEYEEEAHALWNFRDLFGPLNDIELPPTEAAQQAAVKIQALVRGSIVRSNVEDATLMLRLRHSRSFAHSENHDRGYESA